MSLWRKRQKPKPKAEMNERFEQMMLEATKDMPQGYYVPGEYFQKFAELIVKECGVALSPMLRDMVSRGQAYNLIKEHFGVEEHAVCNHDWYSARNPVVKNGSVCVKCGAIDSREPEELKNERTN